MARDPSKMNRDLQFDSPSEIPKAGWKATLLRTKEEIVKDNLSIVAAGVAFYWFLSVFPAIGAGISLYGLIADPNQIQEQVESLSGFLPGQALKILQDQLTSVIEGGSASLSFGFAFSVLLALWSAAKGMKAMMTALNLVYDVEDSRGFIKQNALAIFLTFGAVIFILVSLGLVVIFPAILGLLGLSSLAETLTTYLRWVVLAAIVIIGVGLLYRFAPNRRGPGFGWLSPGAILATVLWLAASIGFSLYVTYFGSYNETYGSIGAVIILLMWMFITAFVVLLGAELNSELENRARRV